MAAPIIQNYTTPGAIQSVVPAYATAVVIDCWGPGGSAGQRANGSANYNGGGGGAFSRKTVAVTPGQTLSGFVADSPLAWNSPISGGDTWFISTTTVLAKGGSGRIGGQASAGVGDIRYSGGDGGVYPGVISGYQCGGAGGASASPYGNGGSARAPTPPKDSWRKNYSQDGGDSPSAGKGATALFDGNFWTSAGYPGNDHPDGGGGASGVEMYSAQNAAGGKPGGGAGAGISWGGRSGGGQIRLTYTIADPPPPITGTGAGTIPGPTGSATGTSFEKATRSPHASGYSAAASEATYAVAREGTGPGLYVSEFLWIGQYRASASGPYDVNQVMLAFDTSTLPAKAITSAKLVLPVAERYGSAVVEARRFDWIAGTSFVPGSALGGLPLLGSATVTGTSVEIPITGLTRSNLFKLVLSVQDQRLNVSPTGDDTFRLKPTGDYLEVTLGEDIALLPSEYFPNPTNSIWPSRDFSAWFFRSTSATLDASVARIDGTMGAWKISNVGAKGQDLYRVDGEVGVGVPVYPSFWIKKLTPGQTGVLSVGDPNNTDVYGTFLVDFTKLGGDWTFITLNHPAVTVTVPRTFSHGYQVWSDTGTLSFYMDHVESGTAPHTYVQSSAPSAPEPITGWASVTLPALTGSSTAVERIRGTTSGIISAPTATVSARLLSYGVASASIAAPTASVTASSGYRGQGSGQTVAPTASANGSSAITGFGVGTNPTFNGLANGGSKLSGSSAGVVIAATALGSASSTIRGVATGSISGPSATGAGTSVPPNANGVGFGQSDGPTGLAFAKLSMRGQATVIATVPAGSANGRSKIRGTATATISAPSATALGKMGERGTASGLIVSPTGSANGRVTLKGNGSAATEAPTATGETSMNMAGSVATVIVGPWANSTGSTKIAGQGSATIGAPSANATGTSILVGQEGTGQGLISAPTGEASGTMAITGQASATIPAPSAAVTTKVFIRGVAVIQIAGPTASANGPSKIRGGGSFTIPAPAGEASGTSILVPRVGVGHGYAEGPSGEAQGTLAFTGQGNVTAMAPTASVAASSAIVGEGAATIPAPTGEASGAIREAGEGVGENAGFTGQGEGDSVILPIFGEGFGMVDGPSGEALATLVIRGEMTGLIPSPTASAAGYSWLMEALPGTSISAEFDGRALAADNDDRSLSADLDLRSAG